ncbi:lipase 3-like [Achroia grisella]|uniref:lipase 3-like n=1 Tax=Achroia grisella TaxID=688607 RepID=UPI0027D3406E|nr:lipase 3-like [Achroia grisella]
MAYVINSFLFVLAICACRGQLLDRFFPSVASSAREQTTSIAGQPLIGAIGKTAGDIFAGTLNTFSRIPVAVARTIGYRGSPSIINNRNLFGSSDRIIAEYKSGLGNEDAVLSIGELIVKYGYPFEEHEVVTEDGYILKMFRIPGNGSVVLLMHGLFGGADDFVIAGQKSSLAYLLANDGYDVWLGNARGNKYSRRHISLQPSEAVFWDFSWHEIGSYDLPAMIDYSLHKTNKRSLYYIGHSQGTTTFFVMGSQRPEYNKKVALMIALSPNAYMTEVKSPFVRLFAPGTPLIHAVLKIFGVYEIPSDNVLMRILRTLVCGLGPLSEILCNNVLMLSVGVGFTELNATNLPVIFGHEPCGAAVKQVAHYGQEFVSGEFQQYDYGSEMNLQKYGSEVPPNYPLERLTAPVSLFYSDSDWMADPIDVDKLYNRLPNCIDIHKVPSKQFNHLDFIWAKNFKSLIYNRVVKLLRAFS